MMKKVRLLAPLAAILVALHLIAPAAAAHPLGNFTINHYAGLLVNRDLIVIDYILDMAEIPAFQEMAVIDANADGQADAAEAGGYHQAKCQALQADLDLRLDGRPAALRLTSSGVEFLPGAGGLPTLRLGCEFQVLLDSESQNSRVEFNNNAYPERLGWREIVISSDDFFLPDELRPMMASISRRLTAYPEELLADPPDQRRVSFTLTPAAARPGQPSPQASAGAQPDSTPAGRSDRFTRLITLQNLTVSSVLLALALAFVWGAAHALTPGHGKTIVAAYLVGSRGTIGHALFLGVTTTITHTAGVFVLGFLTLFAAQFILPEQLYPWLGVMSGTLVVGIGLSLFQGRLRGLIQRGGRRAHHHHDHDHHHGHHHPDHEHPHAHHHPHEAHPGQAHHHLPPGGDDRPVTWRSLLALGISGGLIPCPSALVVMLSAIALQRIGFGLVLIVTFSLGLAGVLTAIGIVWVQARRLFKNAPGAGGPLKHISGRKWLVQALPAASALFIIVIGVGITMQALVQTGLFNI